MTQSFQALRNFVKPKESLERCELCSLALAPEHQHLIVPEGRQILCSCNACALLFSDRQDARFKRIPRQTRFLDHFEITDSEWDSLLIPIGMAFFFYSTAEKKMITLYPSPAGAMESLLALEAWEQISQKNSLVQNMQSDVEALLVNRVSSAREYYIAPIDVCFKLVGIIRANWRGLSGGTEAWNEIRAFFSDLRTRALVVKEERSA
jgi:hypothetical protein